MLGVLHGLPGDAGGGCGQGLGEGVDQIRHGLVGVEQSGAIEGDY